MYPLLSSPVFHSLGPWLRDSALVDHNEDGFLFSIREHFNRFTAFVVFGEFLSSVYEHD